MYCIEQEMGINQKMVAGVFVGLCPKERVAAWEEGKIV